MTWPIAPAATAVTQDFGCTSYAGEWTDDYCPARHRHYGIDLGNPPELGGGWAIYRTPVVTPKAGRVVRVGLDYLGPCAVAIDSGPGDPHAPYLLFGHLDEAFVVVGQLVQAGQVIGLLGTKGNSTGPHLHFSVRYDVPNEQFDDGGFHLADPAGWWSLPLPPEPAPRPTWRTTENMIFVRDIQATDATQEQPFTISGPICIPGRRTLANATARVPTTIEWWAWRPDGDKDHVFRHGPVAVGPNQPAVRGPQPAGVGPEDFGMPANFGPFTLGVVITAGGPINLLVHDE